MAPLVRQYRFELGLSEIEVAGKLGIDIIDYQNKEIGTSSFEGDELVEIWNWFIPLAEKLPENVQVFLKHIHGHTPLL